MPDSRHVECIDQDMLLAIGRRILATGYIDVSHYFSRCNSFLSWNFQGLQLRH